MLLGFIPVLIGAVIGIIIGPFYHGIIAGIDLWYVIADENSEEQIQKELDQVLNQTDIQT